MMSMLEDTTFADDVQAVATHFGARSPHWPEHSPPSRAASPPPRASVRPNTSNSKTRTLAPPMHLPT